MRVLVIGNGQLGSALAVEAARRKMKTTVWDREELDIGDPGQDAYLRFGDLSPDCILLTAALTKVNYCEENEAEAFRINCGGVLTAMYEEARFVYFSTDYVFSGATEPITEDAKPKPLNVYGKSKWGGEMYVQDFEKGHIIRTSGVFGPRPDGSERNFFRAIFEKLSASDGPIEVVDDQFTCVTYAPHLAAMVLELLPNLPKIAHITSAGGNSWYGWAVELATAAGFDPARIVPVPTDPSSPVKRPAYSVLASRYEHINRLIGQFPATDGIAEYVRLLQGRI
jgi:dTDP-4-dehydrorhamnose reductase